MIHNYVLLASQFHCPIWGIELFKGGSREGGSKSGQNKQTFWDKGGSKSGQTNWDGGSVYVSNCRPD